MFNKVVLVGNLTRDIEMRYGQNGNAIGASAIAVTRRFTTMEKDEKKLALLILAFMVVLLK